MIPRIKLFGHFHSSFAFNQFGIRMEPLPNILHQHFFDVNITPHDPISTVRFGCLVMAQSSGQRGTQCQMHQVPPHSRDRFV